MRWLAFALILKASFCIAAPLCPDTRLQQAKIGGDVITGDVVSHHKPLGFALVQLSTSEGFFWLGFTDLDGRFVIGKLPPAVYRIEIEGWGSTSVELDPGLNKRSNGQVPYWTLTFFDDACVATGMNMD